MKERIREIAGELLKTAAARPLRDAPPFEAEPGAYNEYVARLPYEETDDQDRAIVDVIEDLAAGQPMARLISGAVGFGKHDVAPRSSVVPAHPGLQGAVNRPKA